jgi:hypothetical protein
MPTLSGRRRVSDTAKHLGNFAANTVMTALVRARFVDIRPAPVCLGLFVLHLTTVMRRFRRQTIGRTGPRTSAQQHLNFHQVVGVGLGCAHRSTVDRVK